MIRRKAGNAKRKARSAPGSSQFIGPVQPVPEMFGPPAPPKRRNRRNRREALPPRPRRSIWLVPVLILVTLMLSMGVLAQAGKPIKLPVWLVAQAEAKLNKMLAEVNTQPGSSVSGISLGGAVLVVEKNWVPRLRLEDLRLLESDGGALLSLPEVRVSVDPLPLITGEIKLRSLQVVGARIGLQRDKEGNFDLPFKIAKRPQRGIAGIVDTAVGVFSRPLLSNLRGIRADGLILTIDDQLLDRTWVLGDGHFELDNRADEIEVTLGVSLVGGGAEPAQADLKLVASKADSGAHLTAQFTDIAASDLALQAPPLAVLSVLDAPISGYISSSLSEAGKIAELQAGLDIGAGSLKPRAEITPIEFRSGALSFSYDPAHERVDVNALSVRGPSVQFEASGQAYLTGVSEGWPDQMLAQIAIKQVMVDSHGVLPEPVRLKDGALDARIRLKPFRVDIGQVSLLHQGHSILASGNVVAEPKGWKLGVDLSVDQISYEHLLALWPETLVVKTRQWIVDNVQHGELSDVHAAVRIAPGAKPQVMLGYNFTDGQVRFLKTLPPINEGLGYAVLDNLRYLQVLDTGYVSAPVGGNVDISRSSFEVLNIREKPARGKITVNASGEITPMLSLLDQPPFEFITKANLPVDLGKGHASTHTVLYMPLRKGVKLPDITFDVTGEITDFSSDLVVRGRELSAKELKLSVTEKELKLGGSGLLQGVPFTGTYTKQFGPEHKGKSKAEGEIELSKATSDRMQLGLPDGLIGGRGQARFTVDLEAGRAPHLALSSGLSGVSMAIPQLGWSKPAGSKGQLRADVTLSKPPVVDRISLSAAGLEAQGAITLQASGGLNRAKFSRVQLAGLLDAPVELIGRGKGVAPEVSVQGGSFDLRGLAKRGKGGAGGGGGRGSATPITAALDRLVINSGITLTSVRSRVTSGPDGMSGDFTARVNGKAPVSGTLSPTTNGTAVRLLSEEAGAVFSSANIFPNAHGGKMDLRLQPTGAPGEYAGKLKMEGIRIRKAPALAALINAISVVGLLEQMSGSGLLFAETEAEFSLTPRALRIVRGSATGASLGVSASGLYVMNGGRLDMQGVVSPIYLINGIGSLLTRKGEGLFGFNYRLRGTAKDPEVSVNPLSILTPGMFREIFRAPPPKLRADE